MSCVEDFQRWLKEVMRKVIENLGSNVEEAQYELSESTDVFMSSLYHVCVKFKNKTKEGQSEEVFIVLKRPTQIEIHRQMVLIDPQFHNEILFYRTYARPDENFPRCFYTDERPPNDSVIALENVNKRGYSPCPYVFNAPLEYILAAMREIARFHGKGYVMKEQQREKFFDIVTHLQESRINTPLDDKSRFTINSCATRAVEYLRNEGHDAVFCDKMESFLSNAFDAIMKKIMEPMEPLSTLCHGDFTLSNNLFKMEDDGQLRAMLIDFALLRYSTPVVDLSTFLCLGCSNEIRKDNFFEIMRTYHDTLKKYLLDAGIQDIEKYSYDALQDDYKKGVLFGFLIASFFLANLMGYINVKIFEEHKEMENMDVIAEHVKDCKEAGGEKVSKILADMLLEFKDFGFLEHIL
ncbi:uncharacterized protein LOC126855345 [Cataglyphis hispanica]|uniref:uncharacterized protein LOC126855345 n=1 Tax=Cataglyphis hispanica TaxID=1086592 RepID=UPI00217F29B4|nr:uncharacterized protein LOC126855345 [Cataglyphis hispanica]